MTVNFTNKVERVESGTDAREIPEKVAREVIKDTEKASVALQLGNVRRMSTRQERLTLLGSFPEAVWQTGTVDYPVLSGSNASGSVRAKASQPKKTTKVTWDTKALAAEELAIQVVVPDSYIDDSGAPIFEEIKPMIATAFAKKIDSAVFFGNDTPFTQGGLVESAIATGNIVTVGSSHKDLAADVALLGLDASKEGVKIDKFVSEPGFDWRLVGLRGTDGQPIYSQPTEASPGTLYGRKFLEVDSGVWEEDLALLLTGEFDKLILGVRQDITFSLSDSAVIYDPATGLVKYSAFQQDGKVLRAVMRIAYVVVNPVRHLGNVFPFWVLQDNTLS